MAKPFEDLYKEFELIGEKRGEKRGEKKGKIEVAKKLLQKGTETAEIMELTGLSEQEINELIENH